MKRLILSIGMLTMVAMLFSNCKKNIETEELSTDYVNTKNNLTSDLSKVQIYNDSIAYYHNLDNSMSSVMCNKYDSLYHQNDAMFSSNYKKCNTMMTNGTMMSGNAGMMGNSNGGMMNNNSNTMYNQQLNDLTQMQNQMNEIHKIHNNFHAK